MKVTSAEFVISAVDDKGWPKDSAPQVAFVGRSNVGKSSLINSLLNRRNLVKTSSTPGKTRKINFFRINGQVYFVDLPGFGYARVPGKVQEGWGPMVEGYLKGCADIKLVVFLVDIRHDPGKNDKVMHDWLDHYVIPTVYVATKADKISRGNRQKHVMALARGLGIEAADIIQFSAMNGEGKKKLWEAIDSKTR